MKTTGFILASLFIIPLAGPLVGCTKGCNSAEAPKSTSEAPKEVSHMVTPPGGGAALQKTDLKEGTGTEAVSGKKITVHYSGWLTDNYPKEGKEFDTSLKRGQPFQFLLGAGQVIPGWDQGVVGMKVGGKRKLVIPSELAYGDRGAGGVIPPKATLVFEIELLKVE